ncbi:MAG: NAD(P)H-hydrate dehydratase [Pseudomonadota bacterium]
MTTPNSPDLWLSAFPRPTRDAHKYTRGHLAVLGAPALTGATRLAAAAASRIGAGLVSVLSHDQVDVFRASLPPDIMVSSGPATDLKRVTACLLGPGGYEASRIEEVKGLGASVPRILDANALKLWDQIAGPAVLTPHEGEFSRVFPQITGHRTSRAVEAAELTGAVVILKGPDTVIASPGGSLVVNTHASPWLAKAGTGDVLAGMVAGLVAQGMEAFDAACAGVWFHGDAAQRIGPGLIAGDLVDVIPDILGDLIGIAGVSLS